MESARPWTRVTPVTGSSPGRIWQWLEPSGGRIQWSWGWGARRRGRCRAPRCTPSNQSGQGSLCGTPFLLSHWYHLIIAILVDLLKMIATLCYDHASENDVAKDKDFAGSFEARSLARMKTGATCQMQRRSFQLQLDFDLLQPFNSHLIYFITLCLIFSSCFKMKTGVYDDQCRASLTTGGSFKGEG